MWGIHPLQNAFLQPKDCANIFSENQHLALRAMGLSEHVEVDYTEQSAKNFARKYRQKSMTQFCQLTVCKNIL